MFEKHFVSRTFVVMRLLDTILFRCTAQNHSKRRFEAVSSVRVKCLKNILYREHL